MADTLRTGYGGLLAALVVTAAFEAAILARSPIIAKDGIGFIRIAHELADDPTATLRLEDQHPGYPAMVLAASRLVQRVTGKSDFDAAILGAHLASALCGVMSVLLLWLFVRRLYDARVANVTGLLAAAWPLLRLNAADGLSDTPHLMFYLAAAWLAAEALARGRLTLLAAAGVASGLAYWIRPEGLVPGAAAGLVLIANLVGRLGWRSSLCRERPLWRSASIELTSHRPARNATEGVPYRELRDSSPPPISALISPNNRRLWSLAGLGALAAAMLLVASPYVLIAGKVTSKKMPFRAAPSAHAVAIASVEPTAGILGEPRPGGTLPDEFARPTTLAGVFALGLVELGRELAQGLCYLGLIPLTIGSFAPARPRRQPGLASLHVALVSVQAGLLLLLYLVAGYISHRHVIPLVALLLPGVAAGMIVLAARLALRVPKLGPPRRVAMAVAAIWVVCMAPKCLRPLNAVHTPLVEAAQWVRGHARAGDAVLATSSYVRFYADMPGILVGPEAPNLPVGMHFAPSSGLWPFIVLEVDERTFDRGQLVGPNGGYQQTLELAAHRRKPWAKVLVFALRDRGNGLPASSSPRAAKHSSLSR